LQQILDLYSRFAPILAPIALAAYASYFGWLAFSAARAAEETSRVWDGRAWVTREREPQRFRAFIHRFYRLAAFEWLLAVCVIMGGMLLWSGIVTL
jgi:hypothetical protein